jgi:hypothetical protein
MFMRIITERTRSWSDVVQGLHPVDSKRSQSGVYLNSAPEQGDGHSILDTWLLITLLAWPFSLFQ